MRITLDDLNGPEVAELLAEHLRSMARYSPPESIHALDLRALKRPEITFWSAWEGTELVGCAALKALDPRHAELKSMKTSPHHLRRGVARGLLQHLLDQAQLRGFQRISLETGSTVDFEPARRLYERFGFAYCAPFSDYLEDPFSVFMSKSLA